MKPLYSVGASGNINRRETTPAEDRELLLHTARVYLREAQVRRARSPGFADSLLAAAGRCRREAAAIDVRPKQGSLGI